jgi:hypothetical protein
MAARIARLLSVVVLAAFVVMLFLSTARVEATMKYKKDTGKKCTFCHTAPIPKKGDEDPKLNDEGRKFQENGYKLTEEQKRMPD